MNETTRHEIVRLYLAGTSKRGIARALSVSRKTVGRVLAEHARAREVGVPPAELPRPKKRRPSILDEHEGFISESIERFPDITAVRLLELLEERGFRGKYTIVRERLKELRPRPRIEVVERFETVPGVQAQMDFSPYTLDFLREGRRKVHAFSYILSYSRRQYIRFIESDDFVTAIREHVRAFDHLGGLARVCLYDNMKVVVIRFDGEEPIYNPRFLAFATHYGFRPWACKRRRAQTKGKVERPFDFVEKNLLNAREFESLEHLNRVTAEWLATKNDQRDHRTTKRRPIDLWEEERAHLLPLPSRHYDTAAVVYRVVGVEGFVTYQSNSYSVPSQYIGENLPLRITENELIVYSTSVVECARHQLFPRSVTGERRVVEAHRPQPRAVISRESLAERFRSLSPICGEFFESLCERRRYGKKEGWRILELLQLYAKTDLIAAIERAHRYRAFSFPAVERILGIDAEPRPVLEALAEESREHLREWIEGESERIEPRPTAEYKELLEEDHGSQNEQNGSHAT